VVDASEVLILADNVQHGGARCEIQYVRLLELCVGQEFEQIASAGMDFRL